MKNNLYWSVYKNLEDEFINLSKLIHINDKQLSVYSMKNSELIIRAAVEVESISKELYFMNGGTKPNDKNLFFDTDCIQLLESKWKLGKKQIIVSAPYLYFDLDENKILTPLKKANKRGTSSSDWLKAYQAVKHNRSKNLEKGNFKNLIRSLAGLYLLNIYYKGVIYNMDKDSTGTKFDNRLGSDIFSVKLHTDKSICVDKEYSKKVDFDECVYLSKMTDETRPGAVDFLKNVYQKAQEETNSNLGSEVMKQLTGIKFFNKEEAEEKVNKTVQEIRNNYTIKAMRHNAGSMKQIFSELRYEAVLNKHQY